MKKFSCIVATLLVTLSCFSINAFALNGYETGDIVEFGLYPQSQVTDEALINTLNSQNFEWVSYNNYCSYESGEELGTMKPSDFAKYADVEYNGEKYRGVILYEYYPDVTYDECADENWLDNGYYTGVNYWFKYEPIEWVVLDPDEGLLLAKMILDSRPFCNTAYSLNGNIYSDQSREYYVEDYSKSSLMLWLNSDFYETAFDKSQWKNIIEYDVVEDSENASYYGDTFAAYVYPLTLTDLTNPAYGFSADENASDPARLRQGTDYARIQWLYEDDDTKTSLWYLTTAIENCLGEGKVYAVDEDGGTTIGYANCYGHGICPAIRVSSLSSGLSGVLDSVAASIGQPASTDEAPTNWLLVFALLILLVGIVTLTAAITILIVKRNKK